MSVKIVNIFLNHYDKKFVVGKLAFKDKNIYFEYEKEFLDKNIELSPYKLPLKSGVSICEDRIFEGLYGVFADSLPDGWGKLLLDRSLMSKSVKFEDITPLDRLSYIGHFGVGALSYEPVFDTAEIKEVILDDLATSSLEILKGNSEELLDTLLVIGGSSAGARPKAMIQINNKNEIIHGSQELQDGYEHYMVKFPSSLDSKDIGKLEYIYSLIAREANIDMPHTKLLHGKKNSYFAIKRFDRIKDKRVHVHSVAGLTHSDFRLPSLDYDDLMMLAFHLCKDIKEVEKIFRLAVFNLYMHNRDDHAKNFSFLLDEDYSWKLAPAYDLTFSYGPGGEHSTTYLGEGKNPTKEHLLKLAKKHSIKNAKGIMYEVEEAVRSFEKYAKELELSSISSYIRYLYN